MSRIIIVVNQTIVLVYHLGASDDAVTCCLMLEVLDVLSQTDKPLLHNIVFIFNGAEENILQVSNCYFHQTASYLTNVLTPSKLFSRGWMQKVPWRCEVSYVI